VPVSRAALTHALDDAVEKEYDRAPDETTATFIKRYGHFLETGRPRSGTAPSRDSDVVLLMVTHAHAQLNYAWVGDPTTVAYTAINLRVWVPLRKTSTNAYEKTFGAPPMLVGPVPAIGVIDLNYALLDLAKSANVVVAAA